MFPSRDIPALAIAALESDMRRRLPASLILIAVSATAADWPRFRSPNGSGVSSETALASILSPEKARWRVTLPPGHSSPAIADGHIYLTAFEKDDLLTIALDAATGRVLWRRAAPRDRTEPLDKRNSPASPTPVTAANRVFVFFPDYGLLAYDSSGKQPWATRLGPFNNMYGMGASPILTAGKVILVCDQSYGSFIAAFDQDTGRERWRTPRPEAVSGHSTPILYEPPGGGPAQIVAPGSFRMDAYSEETGESVWWINGLASEMKSVPVLADGTLFINGYNMAENDPGRQVLMPPFEEVIAKHDANKDGKLSIGESPDERTKKYFPYVDANHDGFLDAAEWRIYAASFAAVNSVMAIRPGGKGDRTAEAVAWKYHKAIPQLPSTLAYGGVLYMINDAGILTTFRAASGEVIQQARLGGTPDHYYASPVAADGRVLFASQSGRVTLMKSGGRHEVIGSWDLDGEIYATPAIAGGRIYIRTPGSLYCW